MLKTGNLPGSTSVVDWETGRVDRVPKLASARLTPEILKV